MKYLKFNYFFLFFVLVWNPLQALVIKFDGAGRSVLLLSIITFLYNLRRTSYIKSLFKPPFVIWGIWVSYAFIDTMVIGYTYPRPVFQFFTIMWVPLLVMWIIFLEYKINYRILLHVLMGSLLFGLVIIIVFEDPNQATRLGTEMNSNRIGVYAYSFLVTLVYYFYLFNKNRTEKLINLALIIVPVFVIIKTGSRTAFGALSLFLIGQIFINRSKNILKTSILFILGTFILYLIIDYGLYNTDIGLRILATFSQTIENEAIRTGTIFDYFGDRGIFYVLGGEVFAQYPVWGIGLRNFMNYNRHGMEPEIMVHITELGIIGISIFILYMFWFGRGLIKNLKFSYPQERKSSELLVLVYISLFFLASTNTYYHLPDVFVIFGIMAAHTYYINSD